MDFVGNDAWFAVLLTFHVAGAIIGIGPTFTFGVLGPLAGKYEPPPGRVAIMESMVAIERRLIIPVAAVILPLSGALMIWNRGLNRNFWQQEWLYVSIGLYITALFLGIVVNAPAMERMIHMAKSGQAGTPEFGAILKKVQALGPILTLMTVAIIILMVWKPGSGCGPLLRC